jgi:hypothetical protein
MVMIEDAPMHRHYRVSEVHGNVRFLLKLESPPRWTGAGF